MNEMTEFRRALWEQASGIVIDATYSGRSHQALGTRWARINHWLGVPAVVLSAFLAGGAGVTALTGAESWITATLALIAAGLSAARGFLRPDENADLHGLKGDRFISLKNDALLFQDVELRSDRSDEDLQQALRELADRRNNLRESPPRHISHKVYEATKESIERGESSYVGDPLWRDYPADGRDS
jgi:hypothetical protein